MCRIVRIPKGIIVDASCGDFVMSGDAPSKLPRDIDTDFDFEGWVPSIGLIKTDKERAAVENAIFEKYNIAIGESVLLLYEVGKGEDIDVDD